MMTCCVLCDDMIQQTVWALASGLLSLWCDVWLSDALADLAWCLSVGDVLDWRAAWCQA